MAEYFFSGMLPNPSNNINNIGKMSPPPPPPPPLSEYASAFAELLKPPQNNSSNSSSSSSSSSHDNSKGSKFIGGGEYRMETFSHGGDTMSIVCLKGIAESAAERPAYEVLSELLGSYTCRSRDPSSRGSQGFLSRLLGVADNGHRGSTGVHTLETNHLGYSDAGLLTIKLEAESSMAVGEGIRRVFTALSDIAKGQKFNEHDFKIAKAKALFNHLSTFETNNGTGEFFSKFENRDEVMKGLEAVKMEDIVNIVANQILKAGVNLASAGDMEHIPSIRQFSF